MTNATVQSCSRLSFILFRLEGRFPQNNDRKDTEENNHISRCVCVLLKILSKTKIKQIVRKKEKEREGSQSLSVSGQSVGGDQVMVNTLLIGLTKEQN